MDVTSLGLESGEPQSVRDHTRRHLVVACQAGKDGQHGGAGGSPAGWAQLVRTQIENSAIGRGPVVVVRILNGFPDLVKRAVVVRGAPADKQQLKELVNRNPCTTSSPRAFRPRRSAACPPNSRRRDSLVEWLNPVCNGLVKQPEDWRRSSYNRFALDKPTIAACPIQTDYVRLPRGHRA